MAPAMLSTLSFEFLLMPLEFNAALRRINARNHYIESYHFLSPFAFNEKAIQRIFESRGENKINSREFLWVVLRQFIFKFYEWRASKEKSGERINMTEILLSYESAVVPILLLSLKYWRANHFIFAFRTGFARVMFVLWQCLLMRTSTDDDEPPDSDSMSDAVQRQDPPWILYVILSTFRQRLRKVDRRLCTKGHLQNIFVECVTKELEMADDFILLHYCIKHGHDSCQHCDLENVKKNYDSGEAIKKRLLRCAEGPKDDNPLLRKFWTTKGIRQHFPRCIDTCCGWFLCHKKIALNDINRGKIRCKGCRLIKYCSRRHQKLHWKHMHRQHCERLSLLKS